MTLRGWADLYAWQLDRASRTPLTRQIYMQVRSAALAGALRPGTRMPSSRAMASKLGVARASVVSAYEHLLAEGYVEPPRLRYVHRGRSDWPRIRTARRSARGKTCRADTGTGLFRLRAIGGAGRRPAVQHRPHPDRRADRRDVAQPHSSRRAPARSE